MKQFKSISLCLLGALLSGSLVTSCGKTPMNGKLDGEWIMQGKYSKPSAEAAAYSEVTHPQLFWNVSLRLMTITGPDAHNTVSWLTSCRFVYEGNKLAITEAYLNDRGGYRDIPVTPEMEEANARLRTFGLYSLPTHFRIHRLTSSEMILCSEMDSLVFRKRH